MSRGCTGSVYYNYCKKHTNPKNDYVGETDRVNRERGYEHGIIDHKTAKRSASLDYGDEQPEKKTTTTGTRRSTRNKNRKDYKSIQEGSDQRLSEGNTEFSAHVASDIHNRKEDLVSTILCTDESWYRRGVKAKGGSQVKILTISVLNTSKNLKCKDSGTFYGI